MASDEVVSLVDNLQVEGARTRARILEVLRMAGITTSERLDTLTDRFFEKPDAVRVHLLTVSPGLKYIEWVALRRSLLVRAENSGRLSPPADPATIDAEEVLSPVRRAHSPIMRKLGFSSEESSCLYPLAWDTRMQIYNIISAGLSFWNMFLLQVSLGLIPRQLPPLHRATVRLLHDFFSRRFGSLSAKKMREALATTIGIQTLEEFDALCRLHRLERNPAWELMSLAGAEKLVLEQLDQAMKERREEILA